MSSETTVAFLPIACRFVSTDQWLLTYLHPSWKISQVKQLLLAKFMPSADNPHPLPSRRHRPVSPLTFAHPNSPEARADSPYYEGADELEYDSDDWDDENFKYPQISRSHASASNVISAAATFPESEAITSAGSPDRYHLLLFSTGQLLEDHLLLSCYSMQPHELLELHSGANMNDSIIILPRNDPERYIQPYFDVKVRALRGVRRANGETTGRKLGTEREQDKRKRQKKMEWRERWLVIHDGYLKLSRGRKDPSPTHYYPLSDLIALRGSEDLARYSISQASRDASTKTEGAERTVCAHFRTATKTHQRDHQTSASDGSGGWFRRGSRAGVEEEEGRLSQDETIENSVCIAMDMLDETSYRNILRILHRMGPLALKSSFVYLEPPSTLYDNCNSETHATSQSPPPSPISFATSGTSLLSSASTSRGFVPTRPTTRPLSYVDTKSIVTSHPYPEWRLSIVRKARKAGLGDVGRALEYVIFGADDGEFFGRDPRTYDEQENKKKRWNEVAEGSGIILTGEMYNNRDSVNYEDDDDADDGGSEREWESWEEDISRQRRVQAKSPPQHPRRQEQSTGESSDGHSERSQQLKRNNNAATLHTLSSYSSADSLLRRTINNSPPPGSPPRMIGTAFDALRLRPRSPLSQLDDRALSGASSQFQRHGPAYQRSFESVMGVGRRPALVPNLPATMAMSAMSTVSHGPRLNTQELASSGSENPVSASSESSLDSIRFASPVSD